MEQIGIDQARSRTARSLLEAKEILQELGGLPVVIRPSFTLGGTGGGIVWTMEEFDRKVTRGLELSPVHQVLIEESVYGWKEYELELLRDANDNVIIVCPIENLDPMGVHTGDSITVAPAQTLTDKQYQRMRDAAIKMMRSIGKFAGGCNVQFAVEPHSGRMIAVEINPRMSRSSALASKATGYPIAKVAARLAVGYTLDELPNDVTGTTSACFEPSIDYVVVKIPRWNFEKFEGVDEELTTQMKAVGEVMAIGRTFPEALQKAWQSLENATPGWAPTGKTRRAKRCAPVSRSPTGTARCKFATPSGWAPRSRRSTTLPTSIRGSSTRSRTSSKSSGSWSGVRSTSSTPTSCGWSSSTASRTCRLPTAAGERDRGGRAGAA